MYLGLDFLLPPSLDPVLIEVNVGLPGGAEEYDRAYQALYRRPSGIFDRIEGIARRVCGRSFSEYLGAQSFLPALKEMKLWLDGRGPFPGRFHPALRLEDKWVQTRILRDAAVWPETVLLDAADLGPAEDLLRRRGRLAAKLRSGRGGRGFLVFETAGDLRRAAGDGPPRLVQEWIESRVGDFTLSVRAVAFGGEFVCAYANLARREYSNHGLIAVVEEGPRFGLEPSSFGTRRFEAPSWESRLWFGDRPPVYLRRNLQEDEAAEAALRLPGPVFAAVRGAAVRVERLYEALDYDRLPRAWFEDRLPGGGAPRSEAG